MSNRIRFAPIPLSACHLVEAIDQIGDRWSLLILRSALFGVTRFDDFQSELDIPRTVLSGRLRKLRDAGILEAKTYRDAGQRRRSEYVLTEKGRDLQPTLMALTQWSDRWNRSGSIPPLGLRHATSRQAVRAGFVDNDGNAVPPAKIRIALRR